MTILEIIGALSAAAAAGGAVTYGLQKYFTPANVGTVVKTAADLDALRGDALDIAEKLQAHAAEAQSNSDAHLDAASQAHIAAGELSGHADQSRNLADAITAAAAQPAK